ncbi:hypothetical protein H7J86_24350 [Mycobacterium hackensackense]|uniref:hypothetical protein n=1 Tax=Mycobacterium hackensackense TaxID=228909 RepID=UPI002265C8C0|nr:hypothetical protein [Mycobacterium hackensackense]MCV7255299.1 hypothetical protein [Mycobacterium hackensackense]
MSTTLTVEQVDENPDGSRTLYGVDLKGQPVVVTLRPGYIPLAYKCTACDEFIKFGTCPSCGGIPDIPT